MSMPNEYIPSASHEFHPDEVGSIITQCAPPNSNFQPFATTTSNNGAAYFNDGQFFTNSVDYDTAPTFHTTQFNASAFDPKTNNMYAPETTQNSVYWSRQSQPSPFGVLPHEIAADQSKLPYQSTQQNVNFGVPQLSMNVANSFVEKSQVIVTSKAAIDQHLYVSKPVADVNLNSSVIFDQQSMGYCNNVINRDDQTTLKIDESYNKQRTINSQRNSTDSSSDFRSEFAFSNNSQAPVVKYSSEPVMINSDSPHLVNNRLPANVPLIQQKLQDLHEGSPLSPITSTTNHIGQRSHSEPSFFNHNRTNDIISNHVTSPLMYPDMQDVRCQSADRSNVASPYSMELPYPTPVVNSANTNATDISQLNQPLYSMYDDLTNSTTLPVQPKLLSEEPSSTNHTQIKTNNSTNDMLPKPTIANELVGYPSAIMRTDGNFDDQEINRTCVQWGSSASIGPQTLNSQEASSVPHLRVSNQQTLMVDQNEQYNSYFQTSPCPVPPQIINQIANDTSAEAANIFEEQPHNNRYQYSIPNEESQQSIIGKTNSRKRKTSRRKAVARNSDSVGPIVAEFDNRDRSVAHQNLYSEQQNQSVLQNPNFVVDPTNTKYGTPERTVSDVFPAIPPSQFYTSSNINVYSSNSLENVSHESFQNQTVMSSLSNTPSVCSSPVSSQPFQRPMPESPAVPSPSVSLPSYFSSCQSSPYVNNASIIGSDTQPLVEIDKILNADKISKSVVSPSEKTIERRVVVPDIEKEFCFLFESTLPNYDLIARDDREKMYKGTIGTKPTFYCKNADFLASYMKFLENNCESEKTLLNSNSNMIKNWSRSKQIHQLTMKDTETVAYPTAPSGSEKPKSIVNEVKCDFENDPRYYPLPKTSDERRLTDTSSDGENQDQESKIVEARKSLTRKKEKLKRKEMKSKKTKEVNKERKKSVTETEEEVSTQAKSKNLSVIIKIEKRKRKFKSDEEIKKQDVPNDRINDKDQLGQESLPKRIKRNSSNIEEPVRRKIPYRKTKLDVPDKMKRAISSDDEEYSDVNPVWKPRDDEEERKKASTRKSTRLRVTRFPEKSLETNSIQKKNENHTYPAVLQEKLEEDENEMNEGADDSFYIQKNKTGSKVHALWRLRNGRLQKFEQTQENGKLMFSSVLQFVKGSDVRLRKYEKVEVRAVHQSNGCLTVELCDEMYIPTDTKIRDNFMKESLCYESQFGVYVQVLLSQALDSNFLSEIAKENDTYFLENVKVIDDVTTTYLNDLTSVMIWGPSHIETLVKTLPYVSIKSIGIDFRGDDDTNKCCCCCESAAIKTAIFYGQPYKKDTLQCSISNIPNNIDKTINLCKGCVKRIQLFNKIWHQRYHLFAECATRVSKKKSEAINKVTCTPDILNELLVDTVWLSKLFSDVRNTWLLIWTVVQKIKKKEN